MAPTFVVSDVHGYRDDLVAGLGESGLTTRSGSWAGSDAQLWVLGDLLDRGPEGIGVIDLVMALQAQAPAQVHVLMGNHEALALGMKRFPDSRFAGSWFVNGGDARDQAALRDEHLMWMAGLPLVARLDDLLLLHSDTTAYLRWGSSVDEINTTVAAALRTTDLAAHWEVWARLTSRYHFAGRDGSQAAAAMLARLGGSRIVHGHSVIGSLTDEPSSSVTEPLLYADGQVLAVDGGRYDGGPLLVVRLS